MRDCDNGRVRSGDLLTPENLFQLGSARSHDVQVRLKPEGLRKEELVAATCAEMLLAISHLLVAAENVPLVLDRSTQDVANELHVNFGVVLRRHACAHNPVHVDPDGGFGMVRLYFPHDHVCDERSEEQRKEVLTTLELC